MRKLLFIFFFFYSIILFSQVYHKDSVVIQNGKEYNYNVFRFNKSKILIKLGENTTFIPNDKNLENSFICYLTEDHSVGIIIYPTNYGNITDLESFGDRLQKEAEKEDENVVYNYKLTTINGINSLHSNYIYKENGGYVLGSQYIINTKEPIIIQIILKTLLLENAETFLKDYVPMFQTLVNENIFISPNYYK